MVQRLAVLLAAGLMLAVPATAAPRPFDLAPPSPAQRSTAKVVLAAGAGAQRLALWRATNARGQLCVGFAVATAAPPARFSCLRNGLERPVLAVETGGGIGGQATWGIVVGLASPLVARMSADTLFGTRTTRDLTLRPIPSLRGWRAFTTGVLKHPASTTVKAYDAGGSPLVDTPGAAIHPTAPRQAPWSQTWSDTRTILGETPATEKAISVVLADPTLAPVLSSGRPWIELGGPWLACNHRRLGTVLTARLAAPVSFTADLPVVLKPTGPSAYAVAVQQVAVRAARELTIWVDTNLGQVVGVAAASWPEMSGPGPATLLATVSPPQDQGGPDTPGCRQTSG